MFLDWISNHFAHGESTGWYDGEQKVQYIYERIDWQALKAIGCISFVFSLYNWSMCVCLFCIFSEESNRKRLIF